MTIKSENKIINITSGELFIYGQLDSALESPNTLKRLKNTLV
jgi:hypothetical protein